MRGMPSVAVGWRSIGNLIWAPCSRIVPAADSSSQLCHPACPWSHINAHIFSDFYRKDSVMLVWKLFCSEGDALNLIFQASLLLPRYVYDENGINLTLQAAGAVIRDSFNDLGNTGCQILDRSGDIAPSLYTQAKFLGSTFFGANLTISMLGISIIYSLDPYRYRERERGTERERRERERYIYIYMYKYELFQTMSFQSTP